MYYSPDIFHFMHKNCPGRLSMPSSITASTNQKLSGPIDHWEKSEDSSLEEDSRRPLTHLRNESSVVSWDDFELYAALDLAESIWLTSLSDVPKTNVITGSTG